LGAFRSPWLSSPARPRGSGRRSAGGEQRGEADLVAEKAHRRGARGDGAEEIARVGEQLRTAGEVPGAAVREREGTRDANARLAVDADARPRAEIVADAEPTFGV